MKPIFSLALAAAVSLSLLTACAPATPPAASSGPVSSSQADQSLPDLSEPVEAPSSGELKLNKFKNIRLSTLSPNIRIERGENWTVRYTLHNKEKVTRAEVVGDTFYFSSSFKLSPGLDLKDCELIITIPVGTELEDVELATAAGSISLFNLTCQDLEAESVSGNVELDHVAARSLEAESTSGSVVMKSCTADKAEAETISGPVRLDGTFGEAELSSVSGKAELYAQLNRAGHIKTVSGSVTAQSPVKKLEVKTVGAIVVDGQKQSAGSLSLGEGEPSLSIESVSGRVSVDQNALVMIQ